MEHACLRETSNERAGILADIDYSKENLTQEMDLNASASKKGKQPRMGPEHLPKALLWEFLFIFSPYLLFFFLFFLLFQ